jgi:electron transport complex protein RnfB
MAALINLKNQLIEKIDAILPQTQCRQCGYQGCKPYAAAIANGEAYINQCPPGGEAGIRALAYLTGIQYQPLNTQHGEYKPKALAVIDETVCIGCTLCLQACPVDAILGANKHMHTVIAAECTGCELCIAPCPVDCISMVPVKETSSAADQLARSAADIARSRYEFRLARIERERQDRAQKHANRVQKNDTTQAASSTLKPVANLPAINDKKAAIAAAIARANTIKTASQT